VAVYVDNAQVEWRGRLWCHLVADSIDELHEFAKKLGMRKEWFQHAASYPHYDITVKTRVCALELGALIGNRIQIITCARKLKADLKSQKVYKPEQLALFC